MRLNALWWWIDRWRKSTAYTDMTLEQQGAYRNLLDEAQLRGGAIPNDERVLARASGDPIRWKRLRDVVMARFTLKDDGWHNETLDEVIAESHRRADKQKRWRNKQVSRVVTRESPDSLNHGNARGSPDPDPSPDQTQLRATASLRAGDFIQWYEDTHQRLFGVGYMGTLKDYTSALQMVAKFTDSEMRDGAMVWFGMDDDFATNGTRTIPKFASRITGCLQTMKQRGIA